MFKGMNVHPTGQEILAAHGITTPFTYSGLTIEYYKKLAGKYTLTPGGSLNGAMPIVVFVLGFIVIALIIVYAIVGAFNKGAFLKSWLAPEGDIKTMKAVKNTKHWVIAPMMCFASMMSMIVTYANSTNLKYESDKTYIFGQVMGLTPTLVAGIILCVLVTVIVIVGIAVPTSIFNKKFTRHLEKTK